MGERAEQPISIASDGQYLYTSDSIHRCLLKLGTATRGTIEGKVYAAAPGECGTDARKQAGYAFWAEIHYKQLPLHFHRSHHSFNSSYTQR
jgi:phage major head subunit gpT-like protein